MNAATMLDQRIKKAYAQMIADAEAKGQTARVRKLRKALAEIEAANIS